ncbi:MAG TPA: tetratricopeptide repeat protein [Pirellulales bacterium]|jgi:serine/threonine protein kinase|nr:tetratricopeptide repeat protein [Pirellulales bacterium]
MTGRYEKGDEPVPGYWLESFLGQGGFGQVWKAVAPGGTEAALKIISLSGKQGLKEFRALRLVKRIRHPNLVPIFAYWLKDDAGNMIDESVANVGDLEPRDTMVLPATGTIKPNLRETAPRPTELIMAMGLGEKDLSRRLEECRDQGLPGIPADELLGYMEDSARAIDYLNSPKQNLGGESIAVQHCDIKPFNIMIVGGAAQVCDFGLARMLGDVRKTATAAGTVAYVAPECLSTCEPSSSTDQYSLAVTYVELRTGRLPYKSEVFSDVVSAVLKGALDLSDLSPAEQVVIRRATALDPMARYRSTMVMVHELKRAVEQPELAVTAPYRQPRRSPLPALIAVLLLVGIAAGGWYAWPQVNQWWSERTQQKSDNKVAQHVDDAKDKEDDVRPVDNEANERKAREKREGAEKEKQLAEQQAQQMREQEESRKRDEVKTLTDEATKLFDAQKFDESIKVVNRAIKLAPQEASLFLLRGTCYLRNEDYSRAIDDLSQSILLDPRDPRAFSRRAAARIEQGDNQAAISDLTAAINIDPDARDYTSRADAYIAIGHYSPAIEDLTDAIRLDSDSAEAHVKRGRAYSTEHRYPSAIQDFNDALQRDANDPDTLGNLAMLLAMVPDDTVRDGKRAVTLANRGCELTGQKDPWLLDVLAAAYAEIGKFDDAIRTEKRALELQSDADVRSNYEERLKLYSSGNPYRLPR